MNAYHTALKHYLERPTARQVDLATAINRSQPAVHRYARGQRFPDAETARMIDKATKGVVPYKLWESVALQRMGITA